MNGKGKVAIVTAASKGIGAGIARELAREGYSLVLFSRSEDVEALAQELGGIAVRGSVTDAKDLDRLVATTMERHGRIDALVNNTGHPPKGDILAITDDEWFQGMEMVFLNVVRMARLVTPIMEKAGGGSIVNISTYMAFQPSLTYPVSSCLRAGLAAYIKLYTDQYGPVGIRMNNVLPGFIHARLPPNPANAATVPLRRYGTTSELGQTVAFLLSEAAAYVAGQNITVDGGVSRGL